MASVWSWVVGLGLGLTASSWAWAEPLGPVEADRVRLRAHFAEVEKELLAADVSGLTPEQKAKRQLAIQRLRDYRARGVFPHNTDFKDARVPYFIDKDGRACAVGALMIESGAKELAQQISRRENNARVPDIQTLGVAEWAKDNGLTVQECTRIQPGYCNEGLCASDDVPVCGKSGTSYWCKAVLEQCTKDEYAYDGECIDGGVPDAGPPVMTTSDGGCSVRRAGDPGGFGAATLLGALLLLRRRRRSAVLRSAREDEHA
ncbi:MAG: hypothetical protein H6717_37900 [Polyangiaceae bacterium]|nr:hypothetical protein [Polyangiaceae bacterium]